MRVLPSDDAECPPSSVLPASRRGVEKLRRAYKRSSAPTGLYSAPFQKGNAGSDAQSAKAPKTMADAARQAAATLLDPKLHEMDDNELAYKDVLAYRYGITPTDLDDALCDGNPALDMQYEQLDRSERERLGSFFVQSAIEGIEVESVNWLDRTAQRIWMMRRHHKWSLSLLIASVGLMALTMWEPSQASQGYRLPPYHWFHDDAFEHEIVLALELLFILFLGLDCVLQFKLVGSWEGFRLETKRCVESAAVVLMLIDWLYTVSTGKRIPCFRVLRCVPILSDEDGMGRWAKPVQDTFLSTKSAIVSVFELMALSLVFLFMISLSFTIMFKGDYADRVLPNGTELDRAVIQSGNYTESVMLHNFNTIGDSIIALFVLWTAENYPDVVKPALVGAQTEIEAVLWYLFFLIYLVIMFFLLLPIVVASVFEDNKEYRGERIILDQIKARRALHQAFCMLDHNNSQTITFTEFYRMLDRVKPDCSKVQARVFFNMVDADGSSAIDSKEFIRLVDVLILKVSVRPPKKLEDVVSHDQTMALLDELGNRCEVKRRESMFGYFKIWAKRSFWHFRQRLRAIVVSKYWEWLSQTLVGLFLVFLTLKSEYPSFFGACDDSYWTPGQWLNYSFLVLFAVEVLVKFTGLGMKEFFADGWNRVDLIVLVLSILVEIVESVTGVEGTVGCGKSTSTPTTSNPIMGLRAVRIFRLVRLVRVVSRTVVLMTRNPVLRVLLQCSWNVILTFKTFLSLFSLLLYGFAITGMEAFGGPTEENGKDFVQCGEQNEDPYLCPSFQDLPRAFLTLLQLLIGEGWGDVMLSHLSFYPLEKSAVQFVFALLYFLLYVFLLNFVLMNMLAATILEMFVLEKARIKEREDSNQRINKLKAAHPNLKLDFGDLGDGGDAHVVRRSVKRAFNAIADATVGEHSVPMQDIDRLFKALGIRFESAGERDDAIARLDENENGNVEMIEFLDWYHERFIQSIFKRYDADASGYVDPSELGDLLADHTGELMDDASMEQFKLLDRNHDGKLSLKEYAEMWYVYDRSRQFDSIDTNNDGFISGKELKESLELVLGPQGLRARWVTTNLKRIIKQSTNLESETEKRPGSLSNFIHRARHTANTDVMIDIHAFDTWYQHVFRYKQHLDESDEVADVVEARRDDWSKQVFKKNAENAEEVKLALCKAMARHYKLDENEVIALFGKQSLEELKAQEAQYKMGGERRLSCVNGERNSRSFVSRSTASSRALAPGKLTESTKMQTRKTTPLAPAHVQPGASLPPNAKAVTLPALRALEPRTGGDSRSVFAVTRAVGSLREKSKRSRLAIAMEKDGGKPS